MDQDSLTFRGTGTIENVNERRFGSDGVVMNVRIKSVTGQGEHQRTVYWTLNFWGAERVARYRDFVGEGARVFAEGFFEQRFYDKEDGTRGSSLEVRAMYMYNIA